MPLRTIATVVADVAFAHALLAFTVVVTLVFAGGVLAEPPGPPWGEESSVCCVVCVVCGVWVCEEERVW